MSDKRRKSDKRKQSDKSKRSASQGKHRQDKLSQMSSKIDEHEIFDKQVQVNKIICECLFKKLKVES